MLLVGRGQRRHSAGFTLIELMIVVVIVAVLLGIALPAYQNQVIRGHRAAAKSAMLDLANRQEQYLLDNRVYANLTSDLNYSLPTDVSDYYVVTLSTMTTTAAPYFKITMTPQGSQASDGPLDLDSDGVRTPASKWER